MVIWSGALEGLEMNPAFWSGKKVFLTGHTGFKGSWLSLWLQSLGAEVTGFALKPPTHPSLFEVASVEKGMTSLYGDIRDKEAIQSAMLSANPDIVFHMAAQSLVRYSYLNPVETYATNVMGTVHLLEAVRKSSNVKAVINITTDKCYENHEWDWGYRENEAMGGYDPYSNSKGCAELLTSAYRSSFFNSNDYANHGVAIASVRAGNVIGGGDWAQDRLIPDIIKAFTNKQPAIIRNPQAIRPWQHVMEPLIGYITLSEKLYENGVAFAEGWNFGPHDIDARPVEWIVDRLANLWGEGATWLSDDSKHPHEANYLKLDISKARNNLGWSPKLNLEQALEIIVEWYQAHARDENMRQLILNQIASYQKV